MKRFLSLLSTAALLAANLFTTGAWAATSSYSGPAESNAFADIVIRSNASGITLDDSSDASDTGTNDVLLGHAANEMLYIGFDYPFDGIVLDVDTGSTGGEYIVEYWDGTNWDTLVSKTTADFQNDSSLGVLALEWADRPSDWSRTTVTINYPSSTSDNLYFVRLRITSDYVSNAWASQVGVLNYNAQFKLETELSDAITGQGDKLSFTSSSGDNAVYAQKEENNGAYFYAFYTPSSASYTYLVDVSGYVESSGSVTLSESQTSTTVTLPYTHVLVAYNPSSGSEVEIAAATAGTSNTVCELSNKRAYCALTISEDDGNATVYADGYAPVTQSLYNRTTDSESQASNSFTMTYAYVATVTDENGNKLTSATVKTGDSLDISCSNLGDGTYGCVVPTTNTQGKVEISLSGYETLSSAFTTIRTQNSSSQVTQSFQLKKEDVVENAPDLDVTDIDLEDDGDLTFTVENEGDEDVDENEDVFIYIYVDGDKEWSESYSQDSSDTFLDAGEEDTINVGDDLLKDFDEGEEVDIEVCVDATETVDESDESNNCMESTVSIGEEEDEEVDLEVTDLYIDDDEDLKFELENTGDQDVESGVSVDIYVYVDGNLEWSQSVNQGSDEDNEFLDSDENTTFDLGDDLLEDEGSKYEVEVCVDATNTVDESNEDNNCMEEDEEELAEGSDSGDDGSCSVLIDIDNHWAEEFICNLFDRGTVEGRSSRLFEPDETVTRAEFVKMALLDAELHPSATSNVFYDDVSTSDWFYSYVTYATTRGYVEGYVDGTFKPNNPITRGEAVVILMRVAGEELWDFDESDIDFWDVNREDWFAYAVVLADQMNLVEGYGDDSFRPWNNITRGESAKIVDLAFEEFWD